MSREEIRELMTAILARQGKSAAIDDLVLLRDAGFRSLDFSEMALRVERLEKRELNFDAALMRSIATVGDVLDFFERACRHA